MNSWRVGRTVKWVAFAAVAFVSFGLVFGYVVMLLWNALIPDLFNGPVLTFWQAVGLVVLSHILLRGGGGWHFRNGWRHSRWRRRFEEKLAAMSPEEREQFMEEWRHRCGTGWKDHTDKPSENHA